MYPIISPEEEFLKTGTHLQIIVHTYATKGLTVDFVIFKDGVEVAKLSGEDENIPNAPSSQTIDANEKQNPEALYAASFDISEATPEDSGTYSCVVRIDDKKSENGENSYAPQRTVTILGKILFFIILAT